MYLSHATYLKMAVEEAFRGLKEGGLMEGAVLVLDGMVAGRGHRAAANGPHALAACLNQAGPLSAAELSRATLYLSRAPCPLCGEALVRCGIPLLVLPSDGTLGEGSSSRPELIHVPLEDQGMGTRWRYIPGGACAVDRDDNH